MESLVLRVTGMWNLVNQRCRRCGPRDGEWKNDLWQWGLSSRETEVDNWLSIWGAKTAPLGGNEIICRLQMAPNAICMTNWMNTVGLNTYKASEWLDFCIARWIPSHWTTREALCVSLRHTFDPLSWWKHLPVILEESPKSLPWAQPTSSPITCPHLSFPQTSRALLCPRAFVSPA